MTENRQSPDPNDSDNALEARNTDGEAIEIERPIAASSDPADQIPVPIAMTAAEIDERAQAVEAVRGTTADLEAKADENEIVDEEARAEANRPDAVIESRPEEPRIDV